MSRFRKKNMRPAPSLSTASLPDIVFMLLFFFMVTTKLRENTLLVKNPDLPKATEIVKLEKKSFVSNIYVAPPSEKLQKLFGNQPVIQLNESIEKASKIATFIQMEREARNPIDRNQLTVNLKIDSKTPMGIVSDIKTELRKANALKIYYSAQEKNTQK